MNPTEAGSVPALLHEDGATITVTARVPDPGVIGGGERLEWVKVFSLIEEREHPD
jgi:hypothetical protein